ncbi:MotA/TolQ/ExbB proton channel [Moorella glycerini]|uniref:Chemotaxis protein PomA n=1 Tax=Neomoorella stamsii TaxID=1266720 RepID=A0A9X7J1V9_9FIRM|nr:MULTISPECIES: MotA/TolQ/ExbB proton channel family protein [Moorella]PRR72283.1 Chemotaxis protein PomA [Moorella stamsii]CEP68906.1 MotA/TolQ/ExbB proton channel [Moorella glycerini]CEP69584.1 MotA/TolQ/ExbB proton channel [Moorella glycerini]
MRRIDYMTVAGIIAGIGLMGGALVMGGNPKLFLNIPSLMVTVGGSFAAVLINFSFQDVKNVFGTVKQAFTTDLMDPEELIELFGELARKARREGLLALEDDANRLNDPFFSKGIQMMVDAMEPEMIREILETDMAYMARRHEIGQGIFKTWGNLAPSFGLIGTLIGLVQMLAKLDKPETLGPSMALALITTFYGAIMAYMIFIPLAGKLSLRSEQEMMLHQMMLEGIISIQSGVNPRILEERLRSFLAPKPRRQPAGEAEIAQEEVFRQRT